MTPHESALGGPDGEEYKPVWRTGDKIFLSQDFQDVPRLSSRPSEARAGIQYAAANRERTAYWVPAFAGTTAERLVARMSESEMREGQSRISLTLIRATLATVVSSESFACKARSCA